MAWKTAAFLYFLAGSLAMPASEIGDVAVDTPLAEDSNATLEYATWIALSILCAYIS